MTSRRLSFYKFEAGHYQVSTFAGTQLGEVHRLTGPNGPCWRAIIPDGTHLPVDFTSRDNAGEALFQAAEDRSRAARDADLGRFVSADRDPNQPSTVGVVVTHDGGTSVWAGAVRDERGRVRVWAGGSVYGWATLAHVEWDRDIWPGNPDHAGREAEQGERAGLGDSHGD